ncbi:MAG: dTDP-4-dehydrorhamnose reductase [Crenarchaeota archaeon]|nr:dTDP-4-dehydrorhamnose reductase [Thermoproteota archaeon]
MRVFVTGGSGLLGHRIVEELSRRGHEVIATYNRTSPRLGVDGVKWVRIDISDAVAIEDALLKARPDAVIHAAAYTDVDGCEVEKDRAWRVNVVATRSIVRACRVVKSYLIYISTDYVFDGSKGMYSESDIPSPINYYGLTKLVAEEIVKSSDLLYTIVRPSAIYGVGPGKANFATFVADRLMRGEEVPAVSDQYVSPTLNSALARAVAEIVEMRPMGVLHVAGNRMSRYEFAVALARALGANEGLIRRVSMESMRWKARRPRDSSLDTSRARELLSEKLVFDTESSIQLFVEEYRRWRGLCP